MNIPELPLQIAIWLGVLFFLVAGLNQLMSFAERFREKPTPSETYLKVQDHLRIEQEKAERISNLERRHDELQKKLSADIGGVYNRIKGVEDKLAEMPDRVIAHLVNARALNTQNTK